MKDQTTPIDRLQGLPEHVTTWLRGHGVATCEQAYALALQLLAPGSGRVLPAGLTVNDLQTLKDRLDKELAPATRIRLEEMQQSRWTEKRPLGVLPRDTGKRNVAADKSDRPGRDPARPRGKRR